MLRDDLFHENSDFWTSDDERSSSLTDSSDGTHSESSSTNLPKKEDSLAVDSPENPTQGSIPSDVLLAPKPKMIRKRWSVLDTTPIDQFEEMIPDMALRFNFSLDPFQKRAIWRVHNHQHTFVAAHTSAGKTVVAQYALALAAREQRRAIYTSPIKALSNQKFREFKSMFESVGIITGDITLNPDAQCLIVTTEILRSMIYRGDSILNQLSVVIFDEIHYVNDAERGVVWEEVIILLPRDVCLVMLSATVPNFLMFADWVGRTKQREVFTVATSKRPIPLKHYLWCNDREFLVMDQSKFRVAAFNELYKSKRETLKANGHSSVGTSSATGQGKKSEPPRGFGTSKHHKTFQNRVQQSSKRGASSKEKTDTQRLQSLVRRLEANDMLPVVVFCFSRRKCDNFPAAMGKLNLLYQQDERSRVHVFIKESFSALSPVDQKLPQVMQVSSLLSRGLGVHHGGLLPIVKEAVEILFSQGLVKVLFATETFAMGVNMPARSVVFSSIEKHDGVKMRTLLSSEYIQMAGRAGRRGLDVCGNVYILCQSDDPPDQKEVTQMMEHFDGGLKSRFKITFAMLLQLTSKKRLKTEDMLSMSFQEYARACRFPVLKRDKARLEKIVQELPSLDCVCSSASTLEAYAQALFTSRSYASSLYRLLWKYQYPILAKDGGANEKRADPPFCLGRVIVVHSISSMKSSCVACIVGVDTMDAEPTFSLIVLITQSLITESDSVKDVTLPKVNKGLREPPVFSSIEILTSECLDETFFAKQHDMGVSFLYQHLTGVPLSCIEMVTGIVLRSEVLSSVGGNVKHQEFLQCEAHGVLIAKELRSLYVEEKGKWWPMVLPKQAKMVDIKFIESLLKQKEVVASINKSECHGCPWKEKHLEIIFRRRECEKQLKEIQNLMSIQSLHLYDEMMLKKQVLRQRQYIDEGGAITLKGQVAAALTSNDDLIVTETLLANVLHNKNPCEVAAILSCFVFLEKPQDAPLGPTQPIAEAREIIEGMHRELQNQLKACGVYVVHEDWWRMCNFGLCLIAYQWAAGDPFAKIMESSEVQEGTIVRTILRLDELIRKIQTIAKTLLCDRELEELMKEASEKIRRDIIFAMSLYLK